jgi:hypothetical protein
MGLVPQVCLDLVGLLNGYLNRSSDREPAFTWGACRIGLLRQYTVLGIRPQQTRTAGEGGWCSYFSIYDGFP